MNIDIESIIKTALSIGATITISQDFVTIVTEASEKSEPASAPKPEPSPIKEKAPSPKKQGARKDLDMGKVKALRNAGWSFAAIAEEMGVSQQTIANRLGKEAAE